MKKVDDEKLLAMLEQKIPQKEIAAFFGCAESYITKRKKRLLPGPNMDELESFSSLTDQQKRFVIAKAEGQTNVQAVTNSYEVTSKESAKSLGTQLMQNPVIQKSLTELMNIHGLTREDRIKQLRKLVYHNDGNISLKALDQSWKLDGSYAPEKHDNITEVEIRTVIALLASVENNAGS